MALAFRRQWGLVRAARGVAGLVGLASLVACSSVGRHDAVTTAGAATAVNRVDLVRGDAPELAAYGPHKVGVRTLHWVNPAQYNVAQIAPTTSPAVLDTLPRYDRPIDVEVWYPADANAQGSTVITAMIRNRQLVGLQGKAIQDAAPEKAGRYPLVILSHGNPGNRHLFTPIAENLASKGYVVVAIDHVDTTYDTLGSGTARMYSSLANRPLDQMFVLNKVAALSKDATSFLNGLVDADNTALVGYSMGGYGALVSLGAGINAKTAAAFPLAAPWLAGSATHRQLVDARIKTSILFAPAGTLHGWIDNAALAAIGVPVLFIAGSADGTVGYEPGVRTTWQHTSSVPRSLLTFVGAGHNVGAPMAAPLQAYQYDAVANMFAANHYTDPVWDNLRMNNVSQHFMTAWLGRYLKADSSMDAYLQLNPESGKGWKGFSPDTAQQMRFESLRP